MLKMRGHPDDWLSIGKVIQPVDSSLPSCLQSSPAAISSCKGRDVPGKKASYSNCVMIFVHYVLAVFSQCSAVTLLVVAY